MPTHSGDRIKTSHWLNKHNGSVFPSSSHKQRELTDSAVCLQEHGEGRFHDGDSLSSFLVPVEFQEVRPQIDQGAKGIRGGIRPVGPMVESIAVAMTANLALMACISSTMAGRAAMRVFMVSIS